MRLCNPASTCAYPGVPSASYPAADEADRLVDDRCVDEHTTVPETIGADQPRRSRPAPHQPNRIAVGGFPVAAIVHHEQWDRVYKASQDPDVDSGHRIANLSFGPARHRPAYPRTDSDLTGEPVEMGCQVAHRRQEHQLLSGQPAVYLRQ